MTLPTSAAILFEDDDLIAAHKPEGLASIPERDLSLPSLLRLLEAQRRGRLYVVHRLDKDASGVILFAKNPEAHRDLNEQFNLRLIRKRYRTVVHGVVCRADGTIQAPLRPFGSGRMGVDRRHGKQSVTLYETMECLSRFTVIAASPITGRRHQIRVHMCHIGHPIVGDRRYGPSDTRHHYERLMLHAHEIRLRLPRGGEVRIEAPPPHSFEAMLVRLREGM